VVVAIIALLVAILLPAVQRARETARGAVCASSMKQVLTGALMHVLSKRSGTERISLNYSWAIPVFKNNEKEAGVFTCPNDIKPYPIPALYDRYFPSGRSVRTGADGVFNKFSNPSGSRYEVDIQDQVEGDRFGGDAAGNDIDLLLRFRASLGESSAEVTVERVSSAYTHSVLDMNGKTIWNPASQGQGNFHRFPLLWMSYGINAATGLKGVKGTPALLLEAGKAGVVPEPLGSFPNDPLAADSRYGTPLRFRHGNRTNDARTAPANYRDTREHLSRTIDNEARRGDRANVGFLDGHVEKRHFSQMIGDPPTVVEGRLQWHRGFWLGTGRQTDKAFDCTSKSGFRNRHKSLCRNKEGMPSSSSVSQTWSTLRALALRLHKWWRF